MVYWLKINVIALDHYMTVCTVPAVVWQYCDDGLVGWFVAEWGICQLFWVCGSGRGWAQLGNGKPEQLQYIQPNVIHFSKWWLNTKVCFQQFFSPTSVTSCSLMMYFLSWLMMHFLLLTLSLLTCPPLRKSLLCLMPSHTARSLYVMAS